MSEATNMFESLSITRYYWQNNGVPQGEVKFSNTKGSGISIHLTAEDCQAMLAIVADRMVAQAQLAAADLTSAIHNVTQALPAPVDITE